MNWAILFYIIPALLIVASLVVILVIYLKKFPKLTAIDLEAMPEHRQKMKKTSLAEDRLKRKYKSFKVIIKNITVPILKILEAILKSGFKYLKKLEETYKEAASQTVKTDNKTIQKTTHSLESILQEAELLQNESKYNQAEEKYIEAIGLNNTSVEAYKGLAQVYVAKKDYQHALETTQFLQHMNPSDERIWREIGKLHKELGDLDSAMEAYDEALEMGPNNPKNLTALLEVSIENRVKYKAEKCLDKLKEVNPENKKLNEYQQQIDEL